MKIKYTGYREGGGNPLFQIIDLPFKICTVRLDWFEVFGINLVAGRDYPREEKHYHMKDFITNVKTPLSSKVVFQKLARMHDRLDNFELMKIVKSLTE